MNYTSISVSGGGWSWYDNFNGFDQDYDMAYQFDADGDDGFAESYFGLRYLGCSRRQDSVRVNYDQWRWSSSSTLDFPEYVMPLTDEGRYEVLRGRHTGITTIPPTAASHDLANRGSWMLVLGAGSLGDLEPGASAQITFAIVCGLWATRDAADSPARRANLRLNSEWAKIAYNGEDVDGDGKLDPDEDVNRNGILDGEEDLYRTELDLNGNRRWDAGEPIFGDGDGVLDIEEDVYTNALKGIVAGNGSSTLHLPSPPPSPQSLLVPARVR